ncbi:GAF domain-containing protein [Candidatus Poribacteria bacterium]|nr:GAF domain-containing protein [Candidatus Poribacteria bacterium]
MVVDDEITKDLLVQYLVQSGYQADGTGSIREAEAMVKAKPNRYDIALVDLVLPETAESKPLPEGGFKATHRLLDINPDMKVAIFTGKGDLGLEHLQQTANEIGAYRLIIKGSGNEIEMIENLVDTVRQLNEIKTEIEETFNTRQWARGLLDTLDVRLYIVDKDYKLWYVDEKSRRLKEEISPYPLSQQYWFTCHGSPYQVEPCVDCPVKEFFVKKFLPEQDNIAPTIMLVRRPDGLHYVQASVTPLKNAKGEIIATLVASHDVSDSPIVKTLSTVEKLQIVLKAIHSMGYDIAKVYLVGSSGRTLRGVCEIGSHLDRPFEGLEIDVLSDPYTRRTLITERAPHLYNRGDYGEKGCAKLLKKEEVKQWLEFPLSTTDEKLLGLLAVDNRKSGRELTARDLQFVQMYADEVAAILSSEYYANTRQEIDRKLRNVLEDLQKRGYERIRLYEVSRDKKRMMGRVEVGGGLRIAFNQFSIFIHQDENTYRSCIIAREPQLIDVKRDGSAKKDPFASQLGKEDVDEWVEYPLIDKDKGLVGHLNVDNKGSDDAKLTEKDFEIIQPYAQELAQMLADDTTTRPEPYPFFRELDTLDTNLALTGNLNEGLKIILQTAIDSIGSSSGCILILEEGKLRVGSSIGSMENIVKTLNANSTDSPVPAIFHTDKPLIINDAQQDERFCDFLKQINNPSEYDEELGTIQFLAILPLEFHREHQGTLVIGSMDNPLLFAEDNVAALDPICFRAALMIHDWRIVQAAEVKKAWESVIDELAHYLKSPLTTLKGSIERLAPLYRKMASDPYYAEVAEHEIMNLIGMVSEMLDLRKLSTGVSIIQPEDGVAQDIITAVRDKTLFAASENEIEVYSKYPDEAIAIHWDISRVTEALYNILMNAIHYSPSGRKVEFSCAMKDNSVVFKISDQGIGIAQEDRPKIFEKFWKKNRHDHRGAGIGLTFAKAIVEAHGGEIAVESQLGKGSTFTVRLPKYVKGEENE